MKQYGYTGKILRVDLSTGAISHMPTKAYADRFLGGRGIAAKIYWDEVSPEVGAFDAENLLMFFTGPMAGFNGLGGLRWTVCGKSPISGPDHFSYANLGGSWGVRLKYAGYDGVVVKGKSDKPVYLYIKDGEIEIREASGLWGKSTIDARKLLKKEHGKSVSVVSCGPAGEKKVLFATLLADNDASGSSGFGAVMGSKGLKAIAVTGKKTPEAANPKRLKELARHILELRKDEIGVLQQDFMEGTDSRRDVCHGCIGPCIRQVYKAKDGTAGKHMCGSAMFYQVRAQRYYGEKNDVPFFANRICDEFGVDVKAILTLIMWMARCNKAGILTDENTGIPLSKLGSLEFIETMVKKIVQRDGFGDVLAMGLDRAADTLGKEAQALITDYTLNDTQTSAYCPRMYIVSGLLYAIEPRQPIQQLHEIGYTLFPWMAWVNKFEGAYFSSDLFRKIARRFWGSELAVDFTTYEGKALAAKMIQDREYAKESLILCDFMWPILHVKHTKDHMGDPSLESKLLSAVTGKEVDEDGLYQIGERILNLQRAILAREGHVGRESDKLPEVFFTRPLKMGTENPECIAPGKDGEIISRKGAVVDRQKFEQMKDEYYQLRGWDVATGLQTKAKLLKLDLDDIIEDLEERGLVV